VTALRPALILGIAVSSAACDCRGPPTSTQVNGTVRGISFSSPSAVSLIDTNVLGGERHTIWMAEGVTCAQLRNDLFGVSFVVGPDGGVLPALIVSNQGSAFLDPGGAENKTRFSGDSRTSAWPNRNNTGMSGYFVATFDAGTYEGSFVTTPCSAAVANAGCASAPGVMLLGALALLYRRPRRMRRSASHSISTARRAIAMSSRSFSSPDR